VHDVTVAESLLQGLDAGNVLADRGYDSQKLVDFIENEMGSAAVIPSRKTNKEQRECDWYLFKERHLVECFFNKLKQYRRIATRYEKLGSTYLSMVLIGCCLIWLK
jgi:transposase